MDRNGTYRPPRLLQSQFACRALPTELGTPDVASHRGQAPMPCVAHDLFVRDAIPIGGSHESGPQAMGAKRLCQRPLQPSRGSALEKDLAHSIRGQSGASDRFCQELRQLGFWRTLAVPGGVERNALSGMWLEVDP